MDDQEAQILHVVVAVSYTAGIFICVFMGWYIIISF